MKFSELFSILSRTATDFTTIPAKWHKLDFEQRIKALIDLHADGFIWLVLENQFEIAEFYLDNIESNPARSKGIVFNNTIRPFGAGDHGERYLVFHALINNILMGRGTFAQVKWLYEHSPDIHKHAQLLSSDQNSLYSAAVSGELDMINWILSECKSEAEQISLISSNGFHAFTWSSRSRNVHVMQRLYDLLTQHITLTHDLKISLFHQLAEQAAQGANGFDKVWNWIKVNLSAAEFSEILRKDNFSLFASTLVSPWKYAAKWLILNSGKDYFPAMHDMIQNHDCLSAEEKENLIRLKVVNEDQTSENSSRMAAPSL